MTYRGTQGIYNPSNQGKTSTATLQYRSLLELQAYQVLNVIPHCIKYEVEPFNIQYYDPIKAKKRTYTPDLLVDWNISGQTIIQVIEIKPRCFTVLTENTTPAQMTEIKTNEAKWQAITQHCISKGWAFEIWTEDIIQALSTIWVKH